LVNGGTRWQFVFPNRIPKSVVEALELKLNDAVECSIEGGKLVIQPIQALPDLSLEDLLAEVNESPNSEVDWGNPVGGEVW
jgi:antitoxin MazE